MKVGVLVPDEAGELSVDPGLTDDVEPAPTAADSKQTVLVVDDDARLRDLLCTVLTRLDCDLMQAGSGEEALTTLLQRKVAVIVLDINMPGMGGFETAQLIREADELASTPIIFLTGQADDKDLNRGYDLGAVDYLLKPVSSAVLYAKVKALLELDRSFARLRTEAARLHEQQLQIARAAESRQRDELAFTRRRQRLTNIFSEASIDLVSLEKTIVTELGQMFDAECLLRLPGPNGDWHDSFSYTEPGRRSELMQAWLVEQATGTVQTPMPGEAILVQELTARSERVGILCLGRPDGPAFSEVDSARFRGTSVAAALAISNATLYRLQTEYAAVMQATGDAILAVDVSGAIRSCNKAATALFSGHSDTLIGRSILDFAVDAHRERLHGQLAVTLATQQEVSLEMTFAAGTRRPVDVAITLSPIGDSVDLHVAVVVHDLTEIKQAQLVISHLASHDPLTDLANRRQLNERLALLSGQQDGKLAALVYMDVNRFKAVNDTYGHDTGDELLVEIATRLRSAAGKDALVCRIGGDEFIVLLEDVPSAGAAVAVGNRILDRVQEEPVRCKNATLNPSLSMGISCLGASARSPEELLSQADMAMFESKKNRLDTCVLYTDLIGSRHQGEVDLRSEVAGAITRSEFRMAYQPIVNSATGALFGLEALVRWRVGDEEMPATDIIALAESAGQIGALSRWIIARSFADFASLGRSDLKLHVNVSPDHVLDERFLQDLIDAQESSEIPAENICLELTERTFYGDPAAARSALRRARGIGFNLAIDDFGIDHASMTNLLHTPVDWLKIDRTFVAEVHDDQRVQRLVRSQIALASYMQVDLIAEGVENQKQAEWLREAGCPLQQGFSYAHPIEAVDLAAEVKNWAVVLATSGDTGKG